MKIKTFWTIFLKIIGICFLPGIAEDLLLSLVEVLQEYSNDNSIGFYIYLFHLIFMVVFYLFMLKILFFKTDWLIDKMKLDTGFTEEIIDLNIRFSTVLTIAIIVIGGLMFVESLPVFFTRLFEYFKQQETFRNYISSGTVVFHFVKIVIACLLITKCVGISAFLDKQLFKDKDGSDISQ